MATSGCRSDRLSRRSPGFRAGAAFPLLAILAILTAWSQSRLQAQAIPVRIVSTSPSITETLFALGLGDRIVGVSTYCRYPAAVATLPRIGTFLKPNAEMIARLQPDMVFVHQGPNNVPGQLGALGIRTAVVNRGGLPEIFTSIAEISSAANVTDRGARLAGELQAGLDRITAAVAGRAPRKVLIVVGRRTGTLTDIVAVGRGSYLHDIASLAGGSNVLAATGLEYPRISMETVISLAPDVIIDVGEMGESPADADHRRTIAEGLWRRQTLVKAVRQGAVHAVHDEAFVVPGPRIVEVASTMARWLHGVEPR